MYVLRPEAFTTPEDMTEEQQAVAAAHFEYVRGLHAAGALLIAGRTEGAEMGIVVFEAEDEAVAQSIVDADPAVRERLMSATLYPYRLALFRGLTAD
jgi:uncharacterized protein YciI